MYVIKEVIYGKKLSYMVHMCSYEILAYFVYGLISRI